MAKFTLKSKLLIALPMFTLATGIPLVTYIYANKPATIDVHSEHDELIKLVERTRDGIKTTQMLADAFFSTDNHNSIGWFVETLKKEVSSLDFDIIAPIEHRLQRKDSHSPQYITILSKTRDLLICLRGNVERLIDTLEKNKNATNAMALISPLEQLQSEVNKNTEDVLKKFKELHTAVLIYDKAIAKDIITFMDEFCTALEKKSGKAQLLKGLMHRVKSKK